MSPTDLSSCRAVLLAGRVPVAIGDGGEAVRLEPPERITPTALTLNSEGIWLGSEGRLWRTPLGSGSWGPLEPWPADRTATGRDDEMDSTLARIRERHPDARLECRRRFTAIEAARDGDVYAAFNESYDIDGTGAHEFVEWRHPGLVRCATEACREIYFEPLWDEDLDDIVVARSGEVWLAGSCAVRLNINEDWFACYAGPYESWISCACESPDGRLLFGTQGGVLALDPYAEERARREVRDPMGPESAHCRSLGDIDEAATLLAGSDALPWVTRIAASPDGTIWGGMLSAGLLKMGVAESVCSPLFQSESPWRGPAVSFDGSFSPTDTIEPGSWAEEGLKPCTIRGISCDGRGRVWVATDGGLAVLDGEGWHAYATTIGGVELGPVYDIAVAGDGPDMLPESTFGQ